jgi:hypothetical protein
MSDISLLVAEYKAALLMSSMGNITFYAAQSAHYTCLATDSLEVASSPDKTILQ